MVIWRKSAQFNFQGSFGQLGIEEKIGSADQEINRFFVFGKRLAK